MLKTPSALKHVTKFLFETQHLVIEGRTILCDFLKKSFTRLFCFKQIFESGILSSPACNFRMKLIQLGILQFTDLRGWLDQFLRLNSLSCLLPPCRRCPPRRGCFGSCLGSCTLASKKSPHLGELLHQCFQRKKWQIGKSGKGKFLALGLFTALVVLGCVATLGSTMVL